ncbi:ABC transporter substrate-binding protein [Paucibacter sp. R3-3]|uniref:ABC transporter substrate-binding protein n=1 Tax=Roseateles agri TaxID=3098619 RepID=A0ABU5DP11_9BURK|nr:ABC transporter substrate-binding protein [Paucibacter sp. R3-3]MDY0748052.1 ABC transporter substrate-binding protein [Paucibacter sp. R3-3]
MRIQQPLHTIDSSRKLHAGHAEGPSKKPMHARLPRGTHTGDNMHISTRIATLLLSLCTAAAVPAQEAKPPIRVGWMASLTGPLSTAALGIDSGVRLAVDEINAAGGINGRKLELLTRDTAGDPNKAATFAQQLVHADKVDIVIGPVNSGESLATVPLVARKGTPNIVIGAVEELTDARKYPRAFRVINTTGQWVTVADDYVLKTMKRSKIALIGDTTGYGTVSVRTATEDLKKRGLTPVFTTMVDPNKTDLSDEIAKARAANADVIMAWSAATGVLARLINARGDAAWDAPIVGHPSLMALPLKQLLNKPAYWENVYGAGYLATSYDAAGKLPERTQALVDRMRPTMGGGSIDILFWWVSLGYDAVKVAEHGIRKAGSTDPAAIQKALETTTGFKAVLSTLTYGPDKRDGFPDENIAIDIANTFKDGSFRLAPK